MGYKKITTVAAAFAAQNIDLGKSMPVFTELFPQRHRNCMESFYKMIIFVEAINNDDPSLPKWDPDYNDPDVKKWYILFDGGSNDGCGSGFRVCDAFFDWTFTLTLTVCGARLSFRDRARALHAAGCPEFVELAKRVNLRIDEKEIEKMAQDEHGK